MAVTRIDHPDDERLAVYRNLPGRDLRPESGLFIAEGHWLVQRLFEAGLKTRSVMVAERRLRQVESWAPADAELLVVPDDWVQTIAGFKFHSGVMACGIRPVPRSLVSVAGDAPAGTTLLVLPKILSAENLGTLCRIAAGFGVAGLLLGPSACDPYSRRALRVSMGAIFRTPLILSDDLAADLNWLGERAYIRAATVLDDEATPLAQVYHPGRLALLMGSEDQGLDRQWVQQCDWKLTIPMAMGVDSLNVAIAAAVCLYHLHQVNPVRKPAP